MMLSTRTNAISRPDPTNSALDKAEQDSCTSLTTNTTLDYNSKAGQDSGASLDFFDDAAAAMEEGVKAVEEGVKDAVNVFKDLFFTSPEELESNRIFHQELDEDDSKLASYQEMTKYVVTDKNLWAELALNMEQPPKVAAEAAARVAMELASGLKGEEAMGAEITKEQFFQFRTKYIKDPVGAQEFFHRAIFAAFDQDHSGELDEQELDSFLEVFYKSHDNFRGGIQLPPRERLRQLIVKRCDANRDGKLSFEEIRKIIDGREAAEIANEVAAEAAKAQVEEELRLEEERMDREWKAQLVREAELNKKRKTIDRERKALLGRDREGKEGEEWDVCSWLESKFSFSCKRMTRQ